MEFIDVLDKNGEKTGIVRNKQLIYKNGDWHRSVHVWVLNSQNELLIQKRAENKETFPGLWAISIAGHVMSGETNLEAAIREIKEEIGISVDPKNLIYIFSVKRNQPYKDGCLNVHDDVFLLKYDIDLDKVRLQKEELTEIRFIDYKNFKERLINKDASFVPYTEEHQLLFRYLDDNL